MPVKRHSAGLESAATVFAALGDRTRLRLVARLSAEGVASITRLSSGTRITRQAITKHLHVLSDAGVVRGFRHGREQLWELNPEQLQEARQQLELIGRQWGQVLERLKASIESTPY